MKISVITPSYMYGIYLDSCLRSVSRQGVHYEHLVQDNESSDGTAEVISSRAGPNLKVIYEKDEGQSDALNRLLRRVTGELVGWLNADEYYLPGALSAVEKVFNEDLSVDVVYGDTIFVNAEGEFMRLLARHRFSNTVLRYRGCYISTCAAFFRASALRTFEFDRKLRVVMDWDLFMNLAARGNRFRYLRRPLAAFRAHESRVTALPISRYSAEHAIVRKRNGLSINRARWSAECGLGDAAYRAGKIANGSWVNERRLRRYAGLPTEWTKDDFSDRLFEALGCTV